MSDDFIDDEFIEEEEQGSGNGSFLMAVGALFLIFIFAGACTLFFLFRDGSDVSNQVANGNGEEIAARETENAIRMATNEAVAIFVAETETAQALPTDTPTAVPTATTPPTETPVPTNTPVVKAEASEGSGLDEALGNGDAENEDGADEAEVAAEAAEEVAADATPIAGAAAAETEALPRTGLNTSSILAVGLLLVLVLIVVRRFRLSN